MVTDAVLMATHLLVSIERLKIQFLKYISEKLKARKKNFSAVVTFLDYIYNKFI